MRDSTELRQERARLLQAAQKLLDRAENEHRDLTPSEERQFSELLGGANYLGKQIAAIEGRAVPEAWTPEECRQAVADLSKPLGTVAARREQPGWGGLADSNESGIRILRPDQRLSEARSYDLPDGIRADELSLGRFVRGIVTGSWQNAEAERRALSTTPDASGGFLIPEPLAVYVIDLARANSVALQAGVSTMLMESKTLTVPKLAADPTTGWKAEGVAIPEDATTAFEAVTLTSKTLACLVRMSLELFEDAPTAGQAVERAISAAMALAIDKAVLLGSGTGEEPLGIANTTGIQSISMGTNGAAITSYDPFSQAAEKIATENGQAWAVVLHPRDMGAIDRLKDSTGQPLQAPASWDSLRKLTTSTIPTDLTQGTAVNASLALLGDFSLVYLGVRLPISLEISREAGDAFAKGQILIRARWRGDVAVARPKHIVKITGIIPPA
ncbi:MAG: phage major capsid protein [Bacillota bacterium]|nr:phage major capsid protein [Bacillota bacterium]